MNTPTTLLLINEEKGGLKKTEVGMFQSIVANHTGTIIFTDSNKTILYANNAVTKTTGYAVEELLGLTPVIFSSGQTPAETYLELREAINKCEIWNGEFINRRKNGELFRESKSIAAIRDVNGNIQYYFAIGEDLSKRKQYEQQIDHLLYFDTLTGLPNRTGFLHSLASTIETAKQRGQKVAILHVDLDEFTQVVSVLGSENSDLLLIEAGKRIKESLRNVDLVARIGRDDFAIILPFLESNAEDDSKEIAARVLTVMRTSFTFTGQTIAISASIGITLYPYGGNSANDLLRNAISATMNAKTGGGNATSFHQTSVFTNDSGLRDLWQATERGEMCLHYQPQVNLFSGEIIGVEALIRWHHPKRGLLLPGEFIPLIENSHLIVVLGEWVLVEACRQMRAWLSIGLPPLKVSINLAARHFRMPNLLSTIADALAAQNLDPRYLEVEITESVMMQNITGTIETIGLLKELGVRISLDDFGTGFSSMAYLSRFPIDVVKIDQSFIRDITTNHVNAAIAQATIAMSHKLGKTVLAEGVETVEQMQYLQRNECDEMQGYFFSKPCPVEEITRMLQEGVKMNSLGHSRGQDRDCILLVDDEVSILSSLRRTLRREGYNILTAKSALEGFALLAKYPVQIIVSDQRMPEMNGTEFLSRVKTMHPKTVRMVLSGYSDITAVTDAINKGAVYRFLSKPWEDEQLKNEIRGGLRYWRELYEIDRP